jgi:hypothetical protein
MTAPSEQAFLAIAQSNSPATVKILEYKEMEPFFVKGDSNEPRIAASSRASLRAKMVE